MAAHQHEEIRRLFDLVLDVPPDERTVVLESECNGDAGLKQRILAMINAAEDDQFLARPTQVGTLPHDPTEKPGQTIDRYKLLEQIGEGGFGVVYLAEQKEPVRRKVALKIIKLGMDTKQVIARFEAERQALAMMDHPNIARVLDAGATETGRPYFVMQYIRGVPILEYCDTEKLNTRQRLGLFMQVCHAIQHAHQKGIIHRDIKPSNVLITLHDGKPVPKVIDFGIAKATNAELTEKTLFTQHRQLIGTPEYMSPEQAEMSGIDIDTRSDIYSLGVLLYELLTGTTPFDAKSLRSAGLAEIQRIIREEEPQRPSTRLSELSRALPSPSASGQGEGTARDRSSIQYIATHRRAEPLSLSRILRGDLDWIVMKALDKDRTRRYDTANGFAMDVARYLNDEPVMASPPTSSYRLRKFIRRNKGQVIAACFVGAALFLGVAGTSYGMIRAQANEQAAIEEAYRAEEIKRLIKVMFEGVTPSRARGDDTTLIRRLLDDTAGRLANGEIADELVAAELHDILGKVYWGLQIQEPAQKHTAIALEVFDRIRGEQDPLTLQAKGRRAALYMNAGRYDVAESMIREVIATHERLYGKEDARTLDNLGNLAVLLMYQDRHDEAESLFQDLLEIHTRDASLGSSSFASVLYNFALLDEEQGHYSQAETRLRKCLEIQESKGEGHSWTKFRAMNVLGAILRKQEKLAEAEEVLSELVESQRDWDNEHPETAMAMESLAFLYWKLDRLEEARDLFSDALSIYAIRSPPEDLVGTRTNLGNLCNDMARFEDAVAQFEISLPIMRDTMPDHLWTGYAMAGLAKAYRGLDRDEEAVALERDLLELMSKAADKSNASPKTLIEAASAILDIEAEQIRDPKRALSYAKRACEATDWSNAIYLDTFALALHMNDDTAAAVETQKRAIELAPEGTDLTEYEQRLAEYEAALAESTGVGDAS